MSRNSKSVSFEEYRHKSWHDVCKLLEGEEDRGASGDYHHVTKFNKVLTEAAPEIFKTKRQSQYLPPPTRSSNSNNNVTHEDLPPQPFSQTPQTISSSPRLSGTIKSQDISRIHSSWRSNINSKHLESSISTPSSFPINLPPPPSQFQAENKTDELSKNYIMPSSLGSNMFPSPRQPKSQSLSTCLPPPTPYKDDNQGSKTCRNKLNKGPHLPPPEFNDSGSSSEGTYDIIEIKCPQSKITESKESDLGLAEPPHETKTSAMPPSPHSITSQQQNQKNRPKTSTKLSLQLSKVDQKSLQSQNEQIQQLSRIRNGIFNLPEIYCPPPLRPPKQSGIPRIPSPRTLSQLGRVMPSFMHSPFMCNNNNQEVSQERQRHSTHVTSRKQPASPRLANSEPIMKSAEEESLHHFETTSKLDTPDSDRTRFPIIITPRRFDLTGKSKQAFHAVSNSTEDQTSLKCNSKNKCTPQFSAREGINRRPLAYEHQSDPHLIGSPRGSEVISLPSRSEGYHHRHLESSGEGRDCRQTSSQVSSSHPHSKHNCLSPRASMRPLAQPSVITSSMCEKILMECLTNLKSPHWEDSFEAFSQIYNLTEIHPNKVRNLLNKIIWFGITHLSSPRSKLVRMACICFKQLFQTQKRYMEVEGEKIFYRLLDLCGGLANNFIQQESRDALVAAVENMDPLRSISFIELHGAKHKNPHVREFSAYLLNAIMDELPQSKLMNKDFSPRIIPMIVSFLREGLLQTRLHGKLALDKIFDNSTFESKLRRYASPENIRHITETLREFRERRSGHI